MWDVGCLMWDVFEKEMRGPAWYSDAMDEHEMKARTKAFALRVIRLVEALPKNRTCDVIGKQLIRAGTSVGSNYRAVRRAKSTADFLNKLRIVEEEADESADWMELLIESNSIKATRLAGLLQEADEITAIVVATASTTKRRR